jgi:hypothetical protein
MATQPDSTLLEQAFYLAQQQGRSSDEIVTKAVKLYLKNLPFSLQ